MEDIWRTLEEYFDVPIPSPYTYPASFDWYLRVYAAQKKLKKDQISLDN